MEYFKMIFIMLALMLSFHGLYGKDVSVVVDVRKPGNILLNGQKKMKVGKVLKAGDTIRIKNKAYVRIMSRYGKTHIIRYRGLYTVDNKGSVSGSNIARGRIRTRNYYRSLRQTAGYGTSRSPFDINSLPQDVRKKLNQTQSIRDSYLRHLTRYYIMKKYGFKKLAAKEAALCIDK